MEVEINVKQLLEELPISLRYDLDNYEIKYYESSGYDADMIHVLDDIPFFISVVIRDSKEDEINVLRTVFYKVNGHYYEHENNLSFFVNLKENAADVVGASDFMNVRDYIAPANEIEEIVRVVRIEKPKDMGKSFIRITRYFIDEEL